MASSADDQAQPTFPSTEELDVAADAAAAGDHKTAAADAGATTLSAQLADALALTVTYT